MIRETYRVYVLCTASQIIGGDFAKFCGLLRIYELYVKWNSPSVTQDSIIADQNFAILISIETEMFS